MSNSETGRQDIPWGLKPSLPQVTIRGTIAGLIIGSIVLISNFQFGLQSGWVSMMSLPSALLGFAVFKILPISKSFTDVENVYIQSVAVAVGTGPLAYGLIGIVPAIEKFMTAEESGFDRLLKFSTKDLIIWSCALAFFGVFFAIPLRKQVIVEEKLPFPSGSATAILISVLHGTEVLDETKESRDESEILEEALTDRQDEVMKSETNYDSKIRTLVITFIISATYTIVSFFIPFLKNIPIFGNTIADNYLWTFQPSPAYMGQGIIMGLPTVSYMLFGAILGWGILSPLAKYMQWAAGPVDDWKNGSQGWIMWISLSIMISDSLVSFIVIIARSLHRLVLPPIVTPEHEALIRNTAQEDKIDTQIDEKYLISDRSSIFGIIVSSLVCAISLRVVFGALIPFYAIFVAVILALFFSVLAVRALGETDLNPVSGIGKLSQLIFAFIIPSNHPSKILINLIAGGIAEAGAQQAGDLMQDLKTGHLIGCSPRAQFVAQIVGTIYSIFLSSIMYQVYNAVYEIPSKMFRIPTAVIWIDCARLVTGQGLPPMVGVFSFIFGSIFAGIALVKNLTPKDHKFQKYLVYLPSGVAVGVGIYNTPNFTLARFLGGLASYVWLKRHTRDELDMKDKRVQLVILSSGLVLGEGLLSGFTMLLTSLGVH